MAEAASTVATTMRCGITLGNTSRRMMRGVVETDGLRRIDVLERAHLLRGGAHDDGEAVPFQQPSTRMTTQSEPPMVATTASATSTTGSASRR